HRPWIPGRKALRRGLGRLHGQSRPSRFRRRFLAGDRRRLLRTFWNLSRDSRVPRGRRSDCSQPGAITLTRYFGFSVLALGSGGFAFGAASPGDPALGVLALSLGSGLVVPALSPGSDLGVLDLSLGSAFGAEVLSLASDCLPFESEPVFD